MKMWILCFLVSLNSFAYDKGDFSLSSQELKSLNKSQLKKARQAYIDFLKAVEKDTRYEKEKTVFLNIDLFSKAYAAYEKVCFFGGWPSRFENGYCRSPWIRKDDLEVRDFGEYKAGSGCSGANEFRCNPVLFGTPESSEDGYCVNTGGTFTELTEKCESESQDNIEQLKISYEADPTKLNQFFSAIEEFCQFKPNYDACDNLANRLKEITGKEISYLDGTPVSPGPEGEVIAESPPPSDQEGQTSTLPLDEVIPGLYVSGPAPFLNDCRKYLEDNFGNSLLGASQLDPCLGAYSESSFLGALDKLNQETGKTALAQELNETSLGFTLTALAANTRRFSGDLPNDFADRLKEEHPILKENTALIEEAIEKSSHITSLNKGSALEKYNQLSGQIGEVCQQIYDDCHEVFTQKFDNFCNRPTIGERYIRKHREKYFELLEQVFSDTGFKPLFGSEYSQETIFNLSKDHLQECVKEDSHTVFKNPLDSNELNKAINSMYEGLNDEIVLSNERQDDINKGKARDVVRHFLKNDPPVVGITLENEVALRAPACQETIDYQQHLKDTKTLTDVTHGAILLGSAALSFTGAGAPLGAVGFTYLALYSAVDAYSDLSDTQKQQHLLNQALLKNELDAQEAISSQDALDDQKGGAYLGLALASVEATSAGAAFKAARALRQVRQAEASGSTGIIPYRPTHASDDFSVTIAPVPNGSGVLPKPSVSSQPALSASSRPAALSSDAATISFNQVNPGFLGSRISQPGHLNKNKFRRLKEELSGIAENLRSAQRPGSRVSDSELVGLQNRYDEILDELGVSGFKRFGNSKPQTLLAETTPSPAQVQSSVTQAPGQISAISAKSFRQVAGTNSQGQLNNIPKPSRLSNTVFSQKKSQLRKLAQELRNNTSPSAPLPSSQVENAKKYNSLLDELELDESLFARIELPSTRRVSSSTARLQPQGGATNSPSVVSGNTFKGGAVDDIRPDILKNTSPANLTRQKTVLSQMNRNAQKVKELLDELDTVDPSDTARVRALLSNLRREGRRYNSNRAEVIENLDPAQRARSESILKQFDVSSYEFRTFMGQ